MAIEKASSSVAAGLRVAARSVAAALLVGWAGATGAWPAWFLAAAWVPWRAGLAGPAQPATRGRDALVALAALATGAVWGLVLRAPGPVWDRAAYVAVAWLAVWSGARQGRRADALAQAGLAVAGLAPLSALGWALARWDAQAVQAAVWAALSALLWAWAGAVFVAYARDRQRPAWQVSALFFVATLSLAGLAWAAPNAFGSVATPEAAPRAAPTPHPALAATLTAVAQAATAPTARPSPSPTATAAAEPSPTPTPTPAAPTATPTPATPTATPTATPYPTFPPPPVYTGLGVVQVPEAWGQGAFVRNAPRDDAKVVAVVPNGTLLKVLGYRTVGIQIWLKVRALDATWEGWIISTALQVATPAP